MNDRKILERISQNPKNVKFKDFVRVLRRLGFKLSRRAGSHHIFTHPDIREIINIQKAAQEAKPYQIRQFLKLIKKYNLKIGDRD